MSSLISLAAEECHVPEAWVISTIRQGAQRALILRIPKRDPARFRVVYRPSAELEILQRWLVQKFFNQLQIHDSATAFRNGHSILSNAERHRQSKYFVRVDFRDFFPSITLADLVSTIQRSSSLGSFFTDYHDAYNFIEKVCFGSNLKLPIGYISSPIISNAVMFEFDSALEMLLKNNEHLFGKGVITRYADDIVFSTNKKGGCRFFFKGLEALLKDWAHPHLIINSSKTIYSSKAGGSAMVTGLRICNDGHITITRAYKDKIRLMLSLFEKGKLSQNEPQVLKGHLSYVRHVAPAFFSRLCAKHINSIQQLL